MIVRAGSGVRQITPDDPCALFGYPGVERVSTGIHDPLLVSALHLRGGASGIILIVVDVLFLDPPTVDAIRSAVTAATGIGRDSILITCTHTHSAPVTTRLLCWRSDSTVPEPDPAFLNLVKQRAVEAASAATATTMPVEAGWGTARFAPDKGELEGEIGLLSIRKIGETIPDILVIIGDLCPAVLSETSTEISEDFPAFCRHAIAERLGKKATVFHMSAPCGDHDGQSYLCEHTFDEAERIGRALGNALLAELESWGPNAYSTDVPLSAKMVTVDLPPRPLPSPWNVKMEWGSRRADYDRLATEGAAAPLLRKTQRRVFEAEAALALLHADDSGDLDPIVSAYRSAEVQVIRIGKRYIAGLPAMMSREYGRQIRERTAHQCFSVGPANGELQGLIVTPEEAAKNRFGVMASPFGPEAGRRLVDTVVSSVPEVSGSTIGDGHQETKPSR